eukprot:TRINITY_DN1743_c0_g3_i1.p1 TRINITY_DN1743_c0_g3~~TRINITY_DN1743_c0_g3_i1.p1  ORF type:complete len:210 (-),score=35.53 TRINITY_DN1743_c0_g3_i1:1009-1638(-)
MRILTHSSHRLNNLLDIAREEFVRKYKKSKGSLLTRARRGDAAAGQQKNRGITLLPTVLATDPNYQQLRVYFFGTPHFTVLHISRSYHVAQLIAHVLALADVDPQIKTWLTQDLPKAISDDYKNPELFEMRLLEDEEDEESFVPLYETGPLDKERPIGAFLVEGVVFCRIREYEECIKVIDSGILLLIYRRVECEKRWFARTQCRTTQC